jgi:hypothetical protein
MKVVKYEDINEYLQSRQDELISSLDGNSYNEGKLLLGIALKKLPLRGTDFEFNRDFFDAQLQAWKNLHHYIWEVCDLVGKLTNFTFHFVFF